MHLVLDDIDDVVRTLNEDDARLANARRQALSKSIEARRPAEFGGSKPCSGDISAGCKTCGQGRWSCLFLNRICNATCGFCPGDMHHKDAPAYAERIVFGSGTEYAAYIQRFGFEGVSFSGGEAFLTFDRMREFLAALNKDVDRDLYIWAYTNGRVATPDMLRIAVDEGLDEVRFNIAAWDYELDGVAAAIGIVPRVTVEIPAIPEDADKLRAILPQLAELGVDHLNLHQLMLLGDNALYLRERDYTFLRGGSVMAIYESEIAALETVRFALDEQIALPINYCTTAYKSRWQNRTEDLRSGSTVMEKWETQAETGLVRRLWCDVSAEQFKAITASLADDDRWSFHENEDRLYLHPELVPAVASVETYSIVYYKTVVGDATADDFDATGIADYWELDLTDSKAMGIRFIPACAPMSITANEAETLLDSPPDRLLVLEQIQRGLPDYC